MFADYRHDVCQVNKKIIVVLGLKKPGYYRVDMESLLGEEVWSCQTRIMAQKGHNF
jgi:hypothetical protein